MDKCKDDLNKRIDQVAQDVAWVKGRLKNGG
ncbi:hypothetical protein LCGC14_2448490, partial [marine sediment metagenome]